MIKVKDVGLQSSLQSNGYFIIDFLSNTLIDELQKIYEANFDNKDIAFYSTSFHPDYAHKQKVNKEVLSLLNDKITEYFDDYKILGTSFLRKLPLEDNPLPLHQDWTVTDEEIYGSYTLWIPLQDTFITNGALRIIPCSHNIENNLRAPSIPVAFEQDRISFEKYLITLEMKAGQAFVFNQKLMHASWPNSSTHSRLALTIGITPKDAEMLMLYYDKKNNEIHEYSMPDDLFLHYPDIIQKPNIGHHKKTYSFRPGTFNEKELLHNLYKNRMKNSTVQPLFADPKHQEFFATNGFIKLPALEQQEIDTLKEFLYNSGIKKENEYGFYVGMDHEDKSLVSKMMNLVEEVSMSKVSKYLMDYQLITASYVIKDPNPKGVVPPHQDWTFVEDETRHCSVTCWIALVDTDMENGCMGVIKGSNHFFNNVRPSPSPQVPSPLAKHMFSLFPYFELLPMKAGEALIFDNRTFHASPPNISSMPRIAVGLSFTQKDAQLRHYYLKPGTKDTLLKYKITPDFFTKYDNGTLSKMYDSGKLIEGYEFIGEQRYTWEDLSKQEMKDRVLSAGNIYNKDLTEHMKQLFGEYMKVGIKEKIANLISLPKRIVEKVFA